MADHVVPMFVINSTLLVAVLLTWIPNRSIRASTLNASPLTPVSATYNVSRVGSSTNSLV